MLRSLTHPATFGLVTRHAAAVIAAGLAALIAVAIWPGVPAVTAMALVVLGTTGALLERYRTSPALPMMLLLHGSVYAGLYVLFVGATLHQAAVGLSAWQRIDLVLSLVPIALACRLVFIALDRATDGDATTRGR